ncbi:hypothetical protein GGR54DRAFT_644355 [Hypoxylon sp. NC1633]|nr:hypothetical protein GGR54DRAFT_644355 [Hypoxylon sp. NC1633]
MSRAGEKRKRYTTSSDRKETAIFIQREGFQLDMACSECFKHKRKCLMDSSTSERCSECLSRNVLCDGVGVPLDSFPQLNEAADRLTAEEREAENDLVHYQKELKRVHSLIESSLAKVIRLSAQKDILRKKGHLMVQRGLLNLDELEAQEEAEEEELRQSTKRQHPEAEEEELRQSAKRQHLEAEQSRRVAETTDSFN